ncbi:MAG: hypothetical protein O2817_13285 [Proteobacteria bacterium]|nr:hypothetical protein [Pseudomonadota bacterium]
MNELSGKGNLWLFEIGSDSEADFVDGLVRVEGYSPKDRPPEEVATMDRASTYGAHAVFFEAGRHGRASVPQAFVFASKDGSDDSEFAKLHKRLWSWGGVPLLYRKTPGQIQLFRCAHKPDFATTGEPVCRPVRTLEIGAKIASEEAWWDAERIRNGTLWDDPKACKLMLSARKSAHRNLVEAIEGLYTELTTERLLTERLCRRLLILSYSPEIGQ